MYKTHLLKNGKKLGVSANHLNFYTEKESIEAASCLVDVEPDMIISPESTTSFFGIISSLIGGFLCLPYSTAYSKATGRSFNNSTIFDYGRKIPQKKIKVERKESILENMTPILFGISTLMIYPVAYRLYKYAGDPENWEFYKEEERPITKRFARAIVSLPNKYERQFCKGGCLEKMYRPLVKKSAEILKDDEIENLLLVIYNIRDLEVIEKLIEDEFGDCLEDNKTTNV